MRALCLLAAALLVVAARRDTLVPPAVGNDRIIQGKPAKLGQFPHQALFTMDELMQCGGSLISTTTVLTAAHCTQGFKKFRILLGAVDLDQLGPFFWIVVTPWAVEHPDYTTVNDTLYYDVAVIFLPDPAPLSSYINLVDLPSIHEVHNTFVGRKAIISGWGLINNTVPLLARHLQWTENIVIPNVMCQGYYNNMPVVAEISESHLCALSMFSSIGSGDSGSALVLKIEGRYKQIGIVSFGAKYWLPEYPGVYARVTSVIDWIKLKSEDSV